MWSLIVLIWLAVQLPVGLALGRFIACAQKTSIEARRSDAWSHPHRTARRTVAPFRVQARAVEARLAGSSGRVRHS